MWAALIPLMSLVASVPDATKVLRHRRVPGPLHRGIHEMKDPGGWPAEPPSPGGALDGARFDDAMIALCRPVAGPADVAEVARLVREASAARAVDPFLVGALMYRQSRCRPNDHSPSGVGLLGIQPGMFEPSAELPFDRAELAPEALLDPRRNLAAGIALLAMWEAEHASLDRAFESTPHRTGVAHFIWGDRVWGSSGEDRVLTARRRLLEAYAGTPAVARPSPVGFDLVSPLEGVPRLATSGPGADRDGGARTHRGLDVDAVVGEPVRAVADGVVQFAGMDRPGQTPARWLLPKGATRMAARGRGFGPGGLFVRIVHTDGVRTGYFHLSSFRVVLGQTVRAGEVIGTVGRTGVMVSGSHLHFEVDRHGELLDPAAALSAFVIPPEATLTHEFAMAEKKLRLARERRARRRAWLRSRRPLTSEIAPAPSSSAAIASAWGGGGFAAAAPSRGALGTLSGSP
jgi:murein DD-endopeptidase MepM/ murein hydrolase activator NlpD